MVTAVLNRYVGVVWVLVVYWSSARVRQHIEEDAGGEAALTTHQLFLHGIVALVP